MHLNKTYFLQIVVLLCLLCFAQPGFSMGAWDWLNESPVSKFNEDDWTLLRSVGNDLLNRGQDGEFDEWRNDETGNHGTIKIIGSSEYKGKACKKVAFYNAAPDHGLSGRTIQTVCKQPDGIWLLTHVTK